jgi:hypothetical protein
MLSCCAGNMLVLWTVEAQSRVSHIRQGSQAACWLSLGHWSPCRIDPLGTRLYAALLG